jgi:hypothetical protein
MDRRELIKTAVGLVNTLNDDRAARLFVSAYERTRKARPELEEKDAILCAIVQVSGNRILDTNSVGSLLHMVYVEKRLDALVDKGLLIHKGGLYVCSPGQDLPTPEETDVEMDDWVFFGILADILGNTNTLVIEEGHYSLNALRRLTPSHPFWKGWDKVTASITDDGEQKEFFRYCHMFITCGPVPVVVQNNDESVIGLVEKGLAVIVSKKDSDDDDAYRWAMLSVSACRTLFRGVFVPPFAGALSSTAVIIRPEKIHARELFYDHQTAKELDVLRKLTDRDNYRRVAERFSARGRKAGVACLLYGPPGSGKTELVMQTARSSGRVVVLADAAKVTGRYMGETEKAIRELFRIYRYVNAVSENAPILLMNEADGLLWRRDEDPDSSAGRAFNIAQTLFLDEMDSFEGILVATTNMPQAFDGAIFRRFLIKILVGIPNIATRQRIWKERLPMLDDTQAFALAKRFPFTGALIDNVTARCDLHELLEGQAPTYDLVRQFCEQECGGEPGTAGIMPPAGGNRKAS